KCLVSDPHSPPTQLDRSTVFARHQLVMLKSFWWLVRCRPDRLLQRRRAGLNPTGKTLAKHADRAEFQCSGEFIAAARAGALGLRAHGPKRPSPGILAEGNTLQGEARNRPLRPLADYCPGSTSNCVSLYTSSSNHL